MPEHILSLSYGKDSLACLGAIEEICPTRVGMNRVDQLRLLRKNYPDLWALMLKWDKDSPVTFKADGHTVHDFERRFQMEDDGIITSDKWFSWEWLNEVQIPMDYCLRGEKDG